MSINNQHGGDLDSIERIYNIPRNKIIDFSGNINPLGVPESIKEHLIKKIDLVSTYPDKKYLKLRTRISSYINVEKSHIMIGNGSTELISLFIKTINPKNCIIISPAYSEYEREIKIIGGNSYLFELEEKNNFKLDISALKEELSKDIQMLILCNPNNPTGSYLEIEEISDLLEFCRQKDIFVMIDETYVEFADLDKQISGMSLIAEHDNFCVIRGTSKFFASPGLRLGYAACSDELLLEEIHQTKDPWSVNMLANLAGIVMFEDKDYISRSHELITAERNKIIKELSTWKKVKLYDTQANFFLIKITDEIITAADIFDTLIKHKIVIRNAADFSFLGDNFLRFCILSPENNDLLLSILKPILS